MVGTSNLGSWNGRGNLNWDEPTYHLEMASATHEDGDFGNALLYHSTSDLGS